MMLENLLKKMEACVHRPNIKPSAYVMSPNLLQQMSADKTIVDNLFNFNGHHHPRFLAGTQICEDIFLPDGRIVVLAKSKKFPFLDEVVAVIDLTKIEAKK